MKHIDFSVLFPGRDLYREQKERLGKRDLPLVSLLPYQPDMDCFRAFYLAATSSSRAHSIFEDEVIQYAFSARYCSPEDYWPLIIHQPSDLAVELQREMDDARGSTWYEHQQELSTKRRMRSLIELNEDYDPFVDERNYTKLRPGLENTYITELLGMFRATPVRARFVKLGAGQMVEPHIDYDPKYALKVHAPLSTNIGCQIGFNDGRGMMAHFHLEASHMYIVNSGVLHWAENHGHDDRIHLVVSLDGQEDLE